MWTCNLRFWMRGWWSPGSSYWLVPEDRWAKASAWQHSWWLHCQQRNYHLGGHRWPSCGLSQDSQAHLPRRSHLSRECFFLCTLFPNVSRLSVDKPDWLPQGRQCIQRKEGHPRANFGTLHSYLPVLLSTSLSHHPVHLSADLLLRVSATRYIADPVTHRVRSRTCGLEAQKAIFSPLEAITTQKRNCWAEEITLLDSWWCLRNSWPENYTKNKSTTTSWLIKVHEELQPAIIHFRSWGLPSPMLPFPLPSCPTALEVLPAYLQLLSETLSSELMQPEALQIP